ncbi:hypothetical protein GCM10009677_37610 [Sphaerisporangium rubeum]|uniref:DUF4760 domain-containing protein n=1 Tax=Sphaerisporangium rubeum TaxID=321317 RepID=A0A7X0M6J6_9ACTN|nr:hypothetical protein [Sphaerisporangium rubeum]MBB6473778.1 hypothetical protein [Sphaerisporangium rubeum]
MDSESLALILSAAALVVSLVMAMKQVAIMRGSNQLPVLVELFQEFRSEDFQRAEAYVIERLAQENDPAVGMTGLPEEARVAVNKVVGFFSGFAYFATRRMADESLVIPLLGYRANRAWQALDPFIRRERELRGDSDRYACLYEHFVSRIRANMPLDTSFGLRLQTIPPEEPGSSGPGATRQTPATDN